jgi:hypothetical protein
VRKIVLRRQSYQQFLPPARGQNAIGLAGLVGSEPKCGDPGERFLITVPYEPIRFPYSIRPESPSALSPTSSTSAPIRCRAGW